MSKNTNDSVQGKPVRASQPVATSVLTLGTDVADSGINTSFEILQEARSQLKSLTDATLDYADSVTRTTLAFFRTAATRIDGLATTGLEHSQATALDIVAAVRNTGSRVTRLGAGVNADVMGEDSAHAA